MNQTQAKTNEEAFNTLPPHLQKFVKKHEDNMKQMGLIDLAKLDKNKYDDFHPIHAMI